MHASLRYCRLHSPTAAWSNMPLRLKRVLRGGSLACTQRCTCTVPFVGWCCDGAGVAHHTPCRETRRTNPSCTCLWCGRWSQPRASLTVSRLIPVPLATPPERVRDHDTFRLLLHQLTLAWATLCTCGTRSAIPPLRPSIVASRTRYLAHPSQHPAPVNAV